MKEEQGRERNSVQYFSLVFVLISYGCLFFFFL